MNQETLQQAMLMAQLDKKRAIKQKYLRRQAGGEGRSPLTGLVMTNVMLTAVQKRADIFGLLRKLRLECPDRGDFDSAMGQLAALAEGLDCGVYDLFIRDVTRQQRTVSRLLSELEHCDCWENIRTDDRGGGSFVLVGFDYAWRMAERPGGSLLFEKEPVETGFRYSLILGDGRGEINGLPDHGVLWQEEKGSLQSFIDRVLTDGTDDWSSLMAKLEPLQKAISREGETLRDLGRLLTEIPAGPDVSGLLGKSAGRLADLRREVTALWEGLPQRRKRSNRGQQIQNVLLLLGGAVNVLEQLCASGVEKAEGLEEAAYLLENAARPI